MLDRLADDEKLYVWVPEITWRSVPTDKGAVRIIELAEAGKMELYQHHMFALGSVTDGLSEAS